MGDIADPSGVAYNRAPRSSEEPMAKKKAGEVAINYDVPKSVQALLDQTYHELKLAGDEDVTKKELVAECLAKHLPIIKAERLKKLGGK
jgi:hypothetical protein